MKKISAHTIIRLEEIFEQYELILLITIPDLCLEDQPSFKIVRPNHTTNTYNIFLQEDETLINDLKLYMHIPTNIAEELFQLFTLNTKATIIAFFNYMESKIKDNLPKIQLSSNKDIYINQKHIYNFQYEYYFERSNILLFLIDCFRYIQREELEEFRSNCFNLKIREQYFYEEMIYLIKYTNYVQRDVEEYLYINKESNES